MSTDRRWTYALQRGASEAWVAIEGDVVRSSQPDRKPDPRACSLVECFEQGAFFDARDERVRAELVAEISRRIDPASLARPIDRDRLAYARAFDGGRVAKERFAYVLLRDDGSVREAFSWLVDASGVCVRRLDGEPDEAHVLADECFVSGPPTHSAPAWHRAALRAKLASAQKGERALGLDRAAPLVRYAAIERRDWSWDQRSDGESFAGTFSGFVMVGYQYGHDYGTSSLVPENVLRPSWRTRISLHVPSHVLEAIRHALEAAGVESLAAPEPTPEACVAAYRAMAPRIKTSALWARSEELEFDGFGAVATERQWQQSAAMGLFASLCPEKVTSAEREIPSAERLYEFASDAIWLSTDGAAIVRASHCFGAWSGGIDEWWHVAPSPRARVAFAIGTDYTQNALKVVLGADDDAEFAALRAHVVAYFTVMGLAERAR
ncbi:MAG: hypothetical protein JNK05_20745 [Myxococcales bacterium]|nr:hypothetical protein [Myxococcales bacterium]